MRSNPLVWSGSSSYRSAILCTSSLLNQLLDQGRPHTINVHGITGGKKHQALFQSGRAVQILTTIGYLPLGRTPGCHRPDSSQGGSITSSLRFFVSSSGRIISGIISPALCTSTISPTRISFSWTRVEVVQTGPADGGTRQSHRFQ